MKRAKRILSFLLMLLVAISASVLHVSAISADTDEVFSGIDVSVYQGDIDFEQVKNSGIEVVYIRAGYGFSVTDPKFEENYTNATKAGLKCGAYYFVTARNTEQAYLQATRFAELISGKTFAARPAMDFEEFGSLGKNGINIVGLAFMQKLRELTGIVPILYTDAYNASETWDWNFAQFPLWVADYDAEEPYVTSNIWQSYAGFQYSDRGEIPGIYGNVDLDRFTSSVFLNGASEATPTKSPEPVRYTVKRGDTLFYIAWVTGNDFRDLAQRNNIPAPYALNVGQVLQVGNASGQPITGENAVSQASARASGGATTSTTSAQKSTAVVASQPTITYSESSGEQSATKMLPNNKPATTTTTVVAPVTAPTTVSTTQPTASSTSTSSPISAWRWPTDGKVIENFSGAEGGNKGIDIAGSKGQAIVATADGRVVYAGNALRGYGNLIIIKHNDDYLSAYAHNDTMLVREQQEVKAGQKIATMGSTGTSSTRLHFEIRYKGKSVNPLQYLPQR